MHANMSAGVKRGIIRHIVLYRNVTFATVFPQGDEPVPEPPQVR